MIEGSRCALLSGLMSVRKEGKLGVNRHPNVVGGAVVAQQGSVAETFPKLQPNAARILETNSHIQSSFDLGNYRNIPIHSKSVDELRFKWYLRS